MLCAMKPNNVLLLVQGNRDHDANISTPHAPALLHPVNLDNYGALRCATSDEGKRQASRHFL